AGLQKHVELARVQHELRLRRGAINTSGSPSTSVDSKRVGAWQECNMEMNVAFYMTADMAKPYNSYVTDLQNDDLRVLIYAGDADLMCNWNGNQAWTRALEFWHTRSCAQCQAVLSSTR
ncbi:hypothetical protein PR001_g19446, partial [Phytophthora rubi]